MPQSQRKRRNQFRKIQIKINSGGAQDLSQRRDWNNGSHPLITTRTEECVMHSFPTSHCTSSAAIQGRDKEREASNHGIPYNSPCQGYTCCLQKRGTTGGVKPWRWGWRKKERKYKTPSKSNRLDAWPIHKQTLLQLEQVSFNPPISIGRQPINLVAYIYMYTHIHINPCVRTRSMNICSFSNSLLFWQEKNNFVLFMSMTSHLFTHSFFILPFFPSHLEFCLCCIVFRLR